MEAEHCEASPHLTRRVCPLLVTQHESRGNHPCRGTLVSTGNSHEYARYTNPITSEDIAQETESDSDREGHYQRAYMDARRKIHALMSGE